jgi:hypothetical protein
MGKRVSAAARPLRRIASVEKVGENLWRFNARMVHDNTDINLTDRRAHEMAGMTRRS